MEEGRTSPAENPCERFARELLALRGNGIRISELAVRTGLPSQILEEATSGTHLPPLPVALAYASACGADREEWALRWHRAAADVHPAGSDRSAPAASSYSGPYQASSPERRRLTLALGAVLSLGAVVAALTVWPLELSHTASSPQDSTASKTAGARVERFFPDNDPMNRRRPEADEARDSADMVEELLSDGAKLYSGSAGLPLYRATARTPVFKVAPRAHVGEWGPNPLEEAKFPWDRAWDLPGDHAREWSVVTAQGGKAIECLRLRVHDVRPSCEWNAVTDLTKGSTPLCGEPTGSGLSRLAGLITQDEWRAHRIDHALTFGRPDNASTPVYPAVASEEKEKTEDSHRHWHEGQYIWLDDSYDIDLDDSLKPYERTVAHALQEYGAYDVKSTTEFAFTSEYGATPPGAEDPRYPTLTDIKFAEYLRVGRVSPPDRKAPTRCA